VFKLHTVKANEELNLLGVIPVLLNQCVFLCIELIKQTSQKGESLF